MQRGDIIRYVDMTLAEGKNLQKGMNFYTKEKNYSIILMSVRANAPYADKVTNDGQTIIYEGHDLQSNHNTTNLPVKMLDQPMFTPSEKLTENGKFYEAAMRYKNNKSNPQIIKVYEKIKEGIWVYNGFFELVNTWIEFDGNRNVFKFELKMIEYDTNDKNISLDVSRLELEHNRLIPTSVKVQVWKRDKGRCVKCGANKNLHFDHILPFSKGGSSTTPQNIQLLCERCNLQKHDKIE